MEWFAKMCLTVLTWTFFIMLYALIGTILWNSVMPDLFNLPEIKWFKMLCLMVLCNLVIKGFNVNYTYSNSTIKK